MKRYKRLVLIDRLMWVLAILLTLLALWLLANTKRVWAKGSVEVAPVSIRFLTFADNNFSGVYDEGDSLLAGVKADFTWRDTTGATTTVSANSQVDGGWGIQLNDCPCDFWYSYFSDGRWQETSGNIIPSQGNRIQFILIRFKVWLPKIFS